MCKRVALIGLLVLTGCASSSGVLPLADGQYQISTTAITSFGGAATAQASARRRAQTFCATQGKAVEIIEAKAESKFTQGDSSIKFTCK